MDRRVRVSGSPGVAGRQLAALIGVGQDRIIDLYTGLVEVGDTALLRWIMNQADADRDVDRIPWVARRRGQYQPHTVVQCVGYEAPVQRRRAACRGIGGPRMCRNRATIRRL